MYKLAVLGSPIEHSKSPYLQLLFAAGCGVEMTYERIETGTSTLKKTIERLKTEEYNGFNCTMPLKTEMSSLADDLSEGSKFLSSVNTVSIKSGKLYGTTTDGGGMLAAIRRTGTGIAGKNVVLLGSGGTARSIAYSLIEEGAGEIVMINRSRGIFGKLFPNIEFQTFDKLNKYAENADILINATPLGMKNYDDFKDIGFVDKLPPHCVVADAVYLPLKTELLKKAAERGLQNVGGLWMLIYQGAFSFREWTGIMPPSSVIEKTFRLIGDMA